VPGVRGAGIRISASTDLSAKTSSFDTKRLAEPHEGPGTWREMEI
jgi:hypothetical protein